MSNKVGAKLKHKKMRDIVDDSITRLEFPNCSLFGGLKLVCRCSKSAQVLDLGAVARTSDVSDLFMGNSTGNPAVYPNLRRLQAVFSTNRNVQGVQRPVFPEAAPFPNRQRLVLRGKYPFGDDVLFRGNQLPPQLIDATLSDATAMQQIYDHVFLAGGNYKSSNKVRVVSTCGNHRVNSFSRLTGEVRYTQGF